MSGKSCFLFGHRTVPENLTNVLARAIEHHITEYGVTTFYVGHYGAFDAAAAAALSKVKKQHPEITALLLLPYHPAEQTVKTPQGFDGTYYPFLDEAVPRRLAITRANHLMVKSVEYLIAYVRHFGNSRDLLEYAQRRAAHVELHIVNLADEVGA